MASETHPVVTENMGIAGHRKSTSFRIQRDNFVSFFGTEPCMVATLWQLLLAKSPAIQALGSPDPKHLLWALLFFQCCDANSRCAAICGVSIKAHCKWMWIYAEAIANHDSHVVSCSLHVHLFFASV